MSPAQLSFRKDDAFEPGDKLVYDDLTIDAIMDEDMFVYQEMLSLDDKHYKGFEGRNLWQISENR